MKISIDKAKLEAMAQIAAEQVAEESAIEAQKSIQDSRAHSLPFQPPHSRSGKLRRSIHAQKLNKKHSVIADEPYAKELENGSDRVKPRPFLKPAVRKTMKKIGYGPNS